MLSPSKPPVAIADKISKNLPEGKTIIDVFANFMRYLFDLAKALFKSLGSNGGCRWYSAIGLMLIHPNGWGRSQRTHLRNAAVKAGIVPDTLVGHASVYFITKGDASINFSLSIPKRVKTSRSATQSPYGAGFLACLQPGDHALIIDAGDGTIDISATRFSRMDRFGSRNCTNPSVSRIHNNGRFSRFMTFI